MKIITVLVAGLLLIATPAVGYENHYRHAQREDCRFRRNDQWNTSEVRDTIRCVSREFGVDTSTALRVARCESGYGAESYNPGGYAGVFQQAVRYWPGRQNLADTRRWNIRKSVFNARSNVVVSMHMVRSGGWGPWACY